MDRRLEVRDKEGNLVYTIEPEYEHQYAGPADSWHEMITAGLMFIGIWGAVISLLWVALDENAASVGMLLICIAMATIGIIRLKKADGYQDREKWGR